VVVDNTSSDKIAALYPAFLKNGIDVITPNKKAYSSSLKLYEAIIKGSNQGGGRFLNESTVGAGLPIISTLKDLIATGDEVSHGYPAVVEVLIASRLSKSRASCPGH
jgi:homoserine dehydrogenase